MRKLSALMTAFMLLISLTASHALASDGAFDPLSPEFTEWQAKHNTSSDNYNGLIPLPFDLSHLADNPPQEEEDSSTFRYNKAVTIPDTYDLRNINGTSLVTSIKSQLPYGSCWAFASIGAMESNFLKQGYSALDLSEMHLAWYTFRDSNKSKSFENLYSESFEDVLGHGGNSLFPTAMFSRLEGPVLESDVPYGKNKQPSGAGAGSYTRVLRLRDVFYLAISANNINASASARNQVKQRILENGSVVANYYNDNSLYNVTSSGGTAYNFKYANASNHAVQIIGWDDNYSKSNFQSGNQPSANGAWLIKNSWGEQWTAGGRRVGDNGCFWISYETRLTEGSAFVVEENNPDMKAYYYDALGWVRTYTYSSASNVYAANVFKSERSNEKISEVGFYTTDNNTKYEITIYTGISSMPSSSPITGSQVLTQSGTIPYAGWHTVTLDSEVQVTNGSYFAVVVKFNGKKSIPAEAKVSGISDNATIEAGSFFSSNGTNWETGASKQANATIKAYTITGTQAGQAPKITTDYPPDGALNTPYSSVISASGSQPITWSISGSVPTGLTIDAGTGEIYGTPARADSFTFRVTATNAYGSNYKNFTVNIWDVPTITTTSFTGYVGYALNGQLKLSGNASATWTAATKLPAGLTLNSSGAITGKPSKAGEYTASVYAQTSTGRSIADISFTIEARPVKASITTSTLPAGNVDTPYSQNIVFAGTAPVTLTADGLPNGLSFNTSTGNVSGTPTASGTFTIKVTASNIVNSIDNSAPTAKNVKLVIKAKAPKIDTTASLASGLVNEEYPPVQFKLSGGTEDGTTWTASSLPSGLTMSKSGLLSGTPKKAGSFNVTIKAVNNGGSDSVRLPLTVFQKPEITTAKLTNAATDKAYNYKIAAKGTTPITWNVKGLPETLTYTVLNNGAYVQITGTPVKAETYALTVTATNEAGSVSANLDLTVKGVAATFKTSTLAKGTVGSAYTGSIETNGTKPITITCDLLEADKTKLGYESLEELGLSFTSDAEAGTATITGTPKYSVKSLRLALTAENAATTKPVTRTLTLNVSGTKPEFVSPYDATTTLTREWGEDVDVEFEVTGTEKITYSMNTVSGFTLTQTGTHTARLTGKAPSKDGNTSLTIAASNADGKVTRRVVVQTLTKPAITTASLTSATLNKSYSYTLKAAGTKPVWSVDGLPAGLTFAANTGAIKGKPTEAGTFTLSVNASNAVGEDSKTLTLTVAGNNTALPETSAYANTSVPEYTVVAELGEVSADEAGMYDFTFEIDESVEAGAKLLWIANPVDAEESEDDGIAEFYDDEGAETDCVPESHKAGVSVWLREGVTYEPVIAVE